MTHKLLTTLRNKSSYKSNLSHNRPDHSHQLIVKETSWIQPVSPHRNSVCYTWSEKDNLCCCISHISSFHLACLVLNKGVVRKLMIISQGSILETENLLVFFTDLETCLNVNRKKKSEHNFKTTSRFLKVGRKQRGQLQFQNQIQCKLSTYRLS